MSTAETIVDDSIYHGGGTYSRNDDGSITTVTTTDAATSWVVAVAPEFGSNRDHPLPFAVQGMSNFLNWHHDADYLFGTWVNKGTLYIDHVMLTTEEHAMHVAREAGELAIYNLHTKEERFI
jgi:hypothetical protein